MQVYINNNPDHAVRGRDCCSKWQPAWPAAAMIWLVLFYDELLAVLHIYAGLEVLGILAYLDAADGVYLTVAGSLGIHTVDASGYVREHYRHGLYVGSCLQHGRERQAVCVLGSGLYELLS